MNINFESYNEDKVVRYYESLSYVGLLKHERHIIEQYFNNGLVLDLGCGTGRTSKPLFDMGYDVIAVDYSNNMIKAARSLYPDIDFRVGDAKELDFCDNVFDNVLFSYNGLMLIEGFKERERALREICRVLKKGGIFFFSTPCINNKIDRKYWKEKIRNQSYDLSTIEGRIDLGDEIIDEGGTTFYIHVPYIEEIEYMISKYGLEILFSGYRIENFGKESIEDELDDNYVWVVRK